MWCVCACVCVCVCVCVRYSADAHYARHPRLRHFARNCGMCGVPSPTADPLDGIPSPEHQVFSCDLRRLRPGDRQSVLDARAHLLRAVHALCGAVPPVTDADGRRLLGMIYDSRLWEALWELSPEVKSDKRAGRARIKRLGTAVQRSLGVIRCHVVASWKQFERWTLPCPPAPVYPTLSCVSPAAALSDVQFALA